MNKQELIEQLDSYQRSARALADDIVRTLLRVEMMEDSPKRTRTNTHPRQSWTQADRAQLLSMARDGHPLNVIATALNRRQKPVETQLHKLMSKQELLTYRAATAA